MGLRDQATIRSDSGYGDDASEAAHDGSDAHPLSKLIIIHSSLKITHFVLWLQSIWWESYNIYCSTDVDLTALKGYDIGPASKLQIGDVSLFIHSEYGMEGQMC